MSNKILEGCDVLPPLNPAEEPEAKKQPDARISKKKPNSHRFALLNAFVDVVMAGLSSSERAVWLVLYRDADRHGLSRTGQESIARRAGISSRSVRRALSGLESRGLVEVERRGRPGSGPSVYRVEASIQPDRKESE